MCLILERGANIFKDLFSYTRRAKCWVCQIFLSVICQALDANLQIFNTPHLRDEPWNFNTSINKLCESIYYILKKKYIYKECLTYNEDCPGGNDTTCLSTLGSPWTHLKLLKENRKYRK
jgi:hypothetical protein